MFTFYLLFIYFNCCIIVLRIKIVVFKNIIVIKVKKSFLFSMYAAPLKENKIFALLFKVENHNYDASLLYMCLFRC